MKKRWRELIVNWEYNIRDLVYICINVATVSAVFIAYRHRLRQLELDCKKIQKMLHDERGNLNYITVEECKLNRDQVFMAIRRSEKVMEEITREVRNLNNNFSEKFMGFNDKFMRLLSHFKVDI